MGNRPRPDAAACGDVERVSATVVDRGQAQRVDRRLGDREPADPLPCPTEPEQRLGAALQGAFIIRAADLDVTDNAVQAVMGEPGAAERTIPHDVGRGCGRQDRCGNRTLLGEVGPGCDPGRNLGRRFQRSATRRSGACEVDGRSASGNAGAILIGRRCSLRTCPKFKLGARYCTKSKTSPLAELCGSHQPCSSWLMIRISPSPRRYFSARRVLSRRSSRQPAGQRSDSAAQLPYRRNSSSSASSARMKCFSCGGCGAWRSRRSAIGHL